MSWVDRSEEERQPGVRAMLVQVGDVQFWGGFAPASVPKQGFLDSASPAEPCDTVDTRPQSRRRFIGSDRNELSGLVASARCRSL